MPNKWCVLFYWLLVCLDIPGELKNYQHVVDQDFHQNFLRFSLPSFEYDLKVSFKNGTLMKSEVVQGT